MNAGEDKVTIGRYCLFRPLASGGMATVYLGCLRSEGGFSRPVAIKKLHEHHARDRRQVDALIDEARIISRIRHPNVVTVLDVVVEAGQALVVLEYVDGESVAQLLEASSGPPPLGVALRIAVDALEGLHAAHEAVSDRGVPLLVVHRDVSPQNVMVDVAGRARVLDFGVAKALERPYATTETGEFRGKLAYASPEQLSGRGVDRRTDIWAVGAVLWELVAGRRLLVGMEPLTMVARIAEAGFAAPGSVHGGPTAVDAIVLRALARDPDTRFSSGREMALAIEKTGLVADHREVGRWMKKLARTRLDEKSELVSAMEAELRREPSVAGAAEEAATISLPMRALPSRWPVLGAAAAAGAVVVALGVVGVLRGREKPVPATITGAAAASVSAPVPLPPSAEPTLLASAAGSLSAPPPQTGLVTPPPPPPAPPLVKARPRSAAGHPRPASAAGTNAASTASTASDPLRPDERN